MSRASPTPALRFLVFAHTFGSVLMRRSYTLCVCVCVCVLCARLYVRL